jgi:hypothetical protein
LAADSYRRTMPIGGSRSQRGKTNG